MESGVDISCGFLHVDKEGRDSLTYDLMEPYRSKVGALVLKLVEKATFKKGDFIPVSDGTVRLSPGLYVTMERYGSWQWLGISSNMTLNSDNLITLDCEP